MTPLPPGSTIGILGGGQLGRMLSVAAAQIGYRTHIYAPEPSGPAADVTHDWTQGAYDDAEALARFAAAVDVVTYEFENVETAALHVLPVVRPSIETLETAQDRVKEKQFVEACGGRAAPWRAVATRAELDEALAEIGAPAILKTRRFGYDGKGQARLASAADAAAAWEAIGGHPAILEGFVSFEQEFSVIVARGADGALAHWDVPENIHENGILARSIAPGGGLIREQAAEATALAERVAERLGYVGVLAMEFFASPQGPLFNEMAPRVHNSGHWTIEGAVTSQFENHIRALAGLPLGDTRLAAKRVEMDNLIGDAAADWPALFADRSAHVHLYGKTHARPGRKMGHVTRLIF